jgi:hypothetical protein
VDGKSAGAAGATSGEEAGAAESGWFARWMSIALRLGYGRVEAELGRMTLAVIAARETALGVEDSAL